jgi:hypothetical protein
MARQWLPKRDARDKRGHDDGDFVMAGLVPAISFVTARQCPPTRDALDERGHDDGDFVMAGLVPAIHDLYSPKTWMPDERGHDDGDFVMAGLVPAIHDLYSCSQRRGCPRQARA